MARVSALVVPCRDVISACRESGCVVGIEPEGKVAERLRQVSRSCVGARLGRGQSERSVPIGLARDGLVPIDRTLSAQNVEIEDLGIVAIRIARRNGCIEFTETVWRASDQSGRWVDAQSPGRECAAG